MKIITKLVDIIPHFFSCDKHFLYFLSPSHKVANKFVQTMLFKQIMKWASPNPNHGRVANNSPLYHWLSPIYVLCIGLVPIDTGRRNCRAKAEARLGLGPGAYGRGPKPHGSLWWPPPRAVNSKGLNINLDSWEDQISEMIVFLLC